MSNDPSRDGTERTEELLSYASAPEEQGGTVTVAVSTTDEEGIRTHDSDVVEVDIPFEGALSLEIESDDVELTPNQFDGNPRVER